MGNEEIEVLFLCKKISLEKKKIILKNIKHRPQLKKMPVEKSSSSAIASEIHILGDFSPLVAG